MLRFVLFVSSLPALALAFAPPCNTPASCLKASGALQASSRGNACALRAEGGLFGGLFGGGDKKEEKKEKKDDLEDAIDDWKEIGFDIEEVIAAEEKAKKDAK